MFTHEQVVTGFDPATGLRAIVAIHSTALGPALGGCRFRDYASADDAMADALELSKAMTYKNALAGLPHGGGKAVIWGARKDRELLHAMGRFIATLQGRYVTAGDVGISVADLDVIAETNPWTTGRSPERGGAGDTGILTARALLAGMRATAQHVWGGSLAGRRVAISGLGKVGGRLALALADEGAELVVADPDPAAVAAVLERVSATVVDDAAGVEADVYSPNALGHALTMEVARGLRATVVCGAANNQLATPEVADVLAERGVLYAPDYLVNCGGVIQAATELDAGLDGAGRADAVFDTTLAVLERAAAEGITPVAAAAREAEARIAAGRGAFDPASAETTRAGVR